MTGNKFSPVKAALVVVLVVGVYLIYRASFAAYGNPYTCAEAHPYVKQGVYNNTCVKHLQWYLRNVYGYGNIAVDGDFGPNTNSAVRDYQSKHGLAVDGIVGPNTWGSLHSAAPSSTPPPPQSTTSPPPPPPDSSCAEPHQQLKQGIYNSSCVRHLQGYLRDRYGYGNVAVDGDFGPITNSAVRDYQSKHGLAVDGIVGPNTWSSLHTGASYTPDPPSPASSPAGQVTTSTVSAPTATGGKVNDLPKATQSQTPSTTELGRGGDPNAPEVTTINDGGFSFIVFPEEGKAGISLARCEFGKRVGLPCAGDYPKVVSKEFVQYSIGSAGKYLATFTPIGTSTTKQGKHAVKYQVEESRPNPFWQWIFRGRFSWHSIATKTGEIQTTPGSSSGSPWVVAYISSDAQISFNYSPSYKIKVTATSVDKNIGWKSVKVIRQ